MFGFLKRLFSKTPEQIAENHKTKLKNWIDSMDEFCSLDEPGDNGFVVTIGDENNLAIKMANCIHYGMCPDCGKEELYNGPSGGMSTNVICGKCGSEFCFSGGGFPLDRTIRLHNLEQHNNYVPMRKFMLNDWHVVDIFTNRTLMEKQESLIDYCAQNCNDKWSVNNYFFYFKDEKDAMAAKLLL